MSSAVGVRLCVRCFHPFWSLGNETNPMRTHEEPTSTRMTKREKTSDRFEFTVLQFTFVHYLSETVLIGIADYYDPLQYIEETNYCCLEPGSSTQTSTAGLVVFIA